MLKLDPYITDVLLRDLVGHDRRPASFLVYIWFTAEQQKTEQQKTEQQKAEQQKAEQQRHAHQRRVSAVTVSYQDLAESIGISKSSAQSAVGWLIRRKLLTVSKASVTATPEYKALTPWRNRTPRT
jgi:hypothetical protein